MRMTLTVLALSTVSFAGCVTVREPAGATSEQLENDTSIDFDLACRDRDVTFSYRAHASINIYPPHIDVCGGQTITIHITPAVNPAMNPTSVRSVAGNPEPSEWLNRTSSDGNTIELIVPTGVAVASVYKYGVESEGIGSIDPTIRIIR